MKLGCFVFIVMASPRHSGYDAVTHARKSRSAVDKALGYWSTYMLKQWILNCKPGGSKTAVQPHVNRSDSSHGPLDVTGAGLLRDNKMHNKGNNYLVAQTSSPSPKSRMSLSQRSACRRPLDQRQGSGVRHAACLLKSGRPSLWPTWIKTQYNIWRKI